MTVKQKIDALIAAANAKTGNSRDDLTTAIADLIAGFGAGGGELPIGIHGVYYGAVNITETTNTIEVTHGLGYKPFFAAIWTDDDPDIVTYSNQDVVGFIYLAMCGGVQQRYNSSTLIGPAANIGFYSNTSATISSGLPVEESNTTVVTTNTVRFGHPISYSYRSKFSYKVLIVA